MRVTQSEVFNHAYFIRDGLRWLPSGLRVRSHAFREQGRGGVAVAHSLILGMTESGKTTLSKRMSATYKKNEYGILVLDPMCDPGWSADFQTADPDEFLKVFWDSRGCMVFIDESGDMVGRYDQAMQQTATKGRHWGHSVHFLSQRGAQINRTVRDQCSNLFLFNTAKKDAELHAHEWNQPELENANVLPKGEYYHVVRFDKDGKAGAMKRGKLF